MANDNQKLQRHAGIDRLFHWLAAVVMTVLLVTSEIAI
jgi:cytochrome b subunit of formate dehydrogenase